MTALNNYALDIANDPAYKAISNTGVKTAILAIATQLQGFRFQGTAVTAVAALRDLVEDVLRGQGGQVTENVLPPAATTELLISDATTQTAIGAVRTYLTGLSTPTTPAVGRLQSKNAFAVLSSLITQSI